MQEISADISYETVGEGVAQECHDEDEQIEDNEHDIIVGEEDLGREASADEDNLSEEAVSEKNNLMPFD